MKCRCCNQPLRVETQPSIMPGRPAFEIVTCDNPCCDLDSVTLSVSAVAALTPADIAGYARVNAQRRARMQRMAVYA